MHISLSRIGWALLFGASCWGNRSPILLSSMLTIWPRYGSCLAATAGPPPVSGVSTFTRVDLGLSWHPRSQWMLGIWGRNLQSDKHAEVANDFVGGMQGKIPRSVSCKLMWQSSPESK